MNNANKFITKYETRILKKSNRERDVKNERKRKCVKQSNAIETFIVESTFAIESIFVEKESTNVVVIKKTTNRERKNKNRFKKRERKKLKKNQ